MLAFFGLLTILILLVLVLTKKATVHFCLVIVPFVIALLAGFNLADISGFMTKGISSIASTGIMLTFAILFFGVMYEAGMFDPVIKGVIKISGGDPLKLAVGTAIVALCAHLDGSGATTFLITVSALLPIYLALGMKRVYLAAIAGLGAGVMNLVPWGGPTIRAATALNIDVVNLYNPVIPVQVVGIIWVLLAAAYLGSKERKRLGIIKDVNLETEGKETLGAEEIRAKKMLPLNIILTVLILFLMIKQIVPLSAAFILALPIALWLNYPDIKVHQSKLENHAKGAVYTASVIFAAGIFTGILQNSGMIKAMTEAMVTFLPQTLAAYYAPIIGFFSMPLSLFFDPDSFYFGVLPVLGGAAQALGVEQIEIGRAAILGQMTTGFPASPLTGSTWLLLGLAGVELGDLQKVLIPLAWGTTIVMVIAAIIIGVI